MIKYNCTFPRSHACVLSAMRKKKERKIQENYSMWTQCHGPTDLFLSLIQLWNKVLFYIKCACIQNIFVWRKFFTKKKTLNKVKPSYPLTLLYNIHIIICMYIIYVGCIHHLSFYEAVLQKQMVGGLLLSFFHYYN